MYMLFACNAFFTICFITAPGLARMSTGLFFDAASFVKASLYGWPLAPFCNIYIGM